MSDATPSRDAGSDPSEEQTGAVVVGAGPAGLAVAACLTHEGVEHVVLEAADRVGSRWRAHYDRLHLHTVKRHSGLPLHPMPAHYPRYPSRDQVVAYLEDYAARFGIRPRFGCEVTSITQQGAAWRVRTRSEHGEASLIARSVVVATGYNRVPHRPTFAGEDVFGGPVLHSSEYRTGAAFSGQDVLVVGCGNSGAEIALDLCERGARAAMVVRNPVHVVPRDLLGRPSQETSLLLSRLPVRVADRLARAMLRLTVGDLSAHGIRRPKKGPIRMILEEGRVSLLDIGTVAMIKQGRIRVLPAVRELQPGHVAFTDGRRLPFGAVVLATGYRAGLSDLLPDGAVTGPRGLPARHGEETLPGLYFVGYSNPPTGALRQIALEAPVVAASVASRAGPDARR